MSRINFDLEIKFGTKYCKEKSEAVLKILPHNGLISGDDLYKD